MPADEKVKASRSKKRASTLGTAVGGAVSKYEHELLWEVVRRFNAAVVEARQGHSNAWQPVQDTIDMLEDEFADPRDI
jgi:hypothetical protein